MRGGYWVRGVRRNICLGGIDGALVEIGNGDLG